MLPLACVLFILYYAGPLFRILGCNYDCSEHQFLSTVVLCMYIRRVTFFFSYSPDSPPKSKWGSGEYGTTFL